MKFVVHFSTPILEHPSYEQIMRLNMIGHTWEHGDRLYKLAQQHYGDPKLWWVIAWINQKPTEAHIMIGDVIRIPHPLDKVISFLKV
jgi:hypothetical protein